jgi:thiamine pyrophosphate-dependent acetolactate synthase large subunit-like protein
LHVPGTRVAKPEQAAAAVAAALATDGPYLIEVATDDLRPHA